MTHLNLNLIINRRCKITKEQIAPVLKIKHIFFVLISFIGAAAWLVFSIFQKHQIGLYDPIIFRILLSVEYALCGLIVVFFRPVRKYTDHLIWFSITLSTIWGIFLTYRNGLRFNSSLGLLISIVIFTLLLNSYKQQIVYGLITGLMVIIVCISSVNPEINKVLYSGIIVTYFTTAALMTYRRNRIEQQLVSLNIELRERIKEKETAESKLASVNQELKKEIDAKDRFMSILAHDLKSPFQGLIGYLDYIIKEYDNLDETTIKNGIESIFSSSQKTYGMLENLLEWSRSESGRIPFKPEVTEIKHILENVICDIQRIAANKNITIKHDNLIEIPIICDENMIKSVFRNLLTNAIKFSKKDSFIDIFIDFCDNMTSITIRDYGIGIVSENISKIGVLASGYTTNGTAGEKGSGLGMVLVKDFIEKHGGQLEIKSEVNIGTEITVKLPKYNC